MLTGEIFRSPAELADALSSVTVVDTREPRAYRAGHVPGAVNVPYESFRDPSTVSPGRLPDPEDFADLLGEAGIAPDEPIVAYDGDRGVYAARFVLTAAVCGHRGELSLLDGDLTVWERSHEVETDEPARSPVAYDPSPPADPPIVDRDAVEAATEDDTVLVDTRSPAEYDQSHIPGAVQLGWESLVGEDRRLRPTAEIEAELDERGITRDTEVLLYCNTARRLSHTFAVLRELGYEDVRFYEGSLTEWIRAESADWDPVALYDAVRAAAPGGFEGLKRHLGDDVFGRLHLVGLYTQKQDDHFMLRTKVPAGQLTAEQARELGEIAQEFATAPPEHGGSEQNPVFGDGFLDVTTRQGIQLHWISPEDVPEIWDRYESVGLTTLQASGNTLRNVVSCPAAGLADEGCDPRPVAEDVADTFEGNTTYANLPRKLKVSVAGCHENCGRAEIQDLGFTPATKDGRQGFHVKVGGGLSDGPMAAKDLGIFVEPEQVTPLTLATADLFIDHGSYLDTAVNRLKFIVAEWGVDRFREELASYAPFEFEAAGEDHTTRFRGDHVGVHQQDDGRYYVGLNVPTGRLGGEDFRRLAELAETYGDGDIRLTPNQNVLLPHVDGEDVDDLLAEDLLDRYSPDPGPFSRGIVTCTGREFCSYGLVETKSRGHRWATALDEWAAAELDDPPEVVRIHMSGCSASCAQPQIADVALRGETYRDEQGTQPAVDVGLGGDLGRGEFADWLAGDVPIAELPAAVRRLVEAADTDFGDWLAETADDDLYRLVTDDSRSVTVEGD
jgi:ferredoxin-nitrite reductase